MGIGKHVRKLFHRPVKSGTLGIKDGDNFIPIGDPPRKVFKRERRIKDTICLCGFLGGITVLLVCTAALALHGLGWTGALMLASSLTVSASVIGFFGS